jgi:hypothetical protein
MKKDSRIIEVLDWLREWLGNTFVVNDHWESDLCAIGISAQKKPSQIMYISTLELPDGLYDVDLDMVTTPGSKVPYETLERHRRVSREELLRFAVQHLELSVQPRKRN